MQRLYTPLLTNHLEQWDQMLFMVGPRQVGKTTIAKSAAQLTDNLSYLNWDNRDQRNIILSGPTKTAEFAQLNSAHEHESIIIFDEIHKYPDWKNFLKGFFDTYKDSTKIIVTGSAKLDILNKAGDSMMGRYFPYRVHPFSVAECCQQIIDDSEIKQPKPIPDELFQQLITFGGFPEPFLKNQARFSKRWQDLRSQQLCRGDIRDLTSIQDIDRLEVLAVLLKQQVGQILNRNNLSNKLNIANDTTARWLKTLEAFYYCFTIKPWTKNITRSLLKEPKIYMWDWSEVTDPGAKLENFVASHLLKAIHFWNDYGIGDYELYFLRDKDKREVDFLVSKNRKPWFIVEVKASSNNHVSKSLVAFQQQTQAPHAFQVVFDQDYVQKDCFSYTSPTIVPAQTFLSQLI